MGVSRDDYLMFGVDVGYSSDHYDRCQAEYEGAPERRFDIVSDGMSGQYCIAGKIIAQSDPYEGIGMVRIEPAALDVDRAALAATLSEVFEKPIKPDDLALILFTHFS